MATCVDFGFEPGEPMDERCEPDGWERPVTERDFLCDLQKRVGELQFLAGVLFQEIGMRLDTIESAPLPGDDVDADFCDPFADE